VRRLAATGFTCEHVTRRTDAGARRRLIVLEQRGANRMIVVNTETIAGYQVVEVKGIVQGNTVRAKHVGRDIAASLKNIVGGELRGYTELLTESRREAMERMLMQAQQLGANAVVNVRFSTSSVTAGAAELYAYGTAVVVRQAGSVA
jgi:uncharacterized protein YbjQ (UPF0145 family)